MTFKTALKRSAALGAVAAIALLVPAMAFASDAGGGTAAAGGGMSLVGFGKTLMMGLAVAAATIAQSMATGRATESASRNPSVAGNVQTMMIIGLALIESLVLFTLVAIFLI